MTSLLLLETLPLELQTMLIDMDVECYIKWPLLCRYTSVSRFDDAFRKSGVVESFYPSGNIAKRFNFKNGQEHGLCIRWYSNGQILSQSSYHNGKLNGDSKTWTPKGKIESEGLYEHGVMIESSEYNNEGKLVKSSRVVKYELTKMKKLNGDSTWLPKGKIKPAALYEHVVMIESLEYSSTGRVFRTSTVVKDKRTGMKKEEYVSGMDIITKIYYNEKGKEKKRQRYCTTDKALRSERTRAGDDLWKITNYHLRGVMYEQYYENGKGKKEGKYKYWHACSNIVKIKCSYVNGKQVGEHIYWSPNGKMGSRYNCSALGINGKYERWYLSGKRESKTMFVNNMMCGEHKKWFEQTGRLQEHFFYVNNELCGKYHTWHQNGQLKRSCVYTESGIEGEDIEYHENGVISSKCFWVNGLRVGRHFVQYEDGSLKEEVYYNKKGRKHGGYKRWNKNGELHTKEKYKDGKLQRK